MMKKTIDSSNHAFNGAASECKFKDSNFACVKGDIFWSKTEAFMQTSSIAKMFLTFVIFRSDTILTLLLIFRSCYFAKHSHCILFYILGCGTG